MTKLIIETDNHWTKHKIQSVILTETTLLKRMIQNIQRTIHNFEQRYGRKNPEELYGQVDDMELIEWEGEIETLKRFRGKLQSLEEIRFEYH